MKSSFNHLVFSAMIILAVTSFIAGTFSVLHAQTITLGPIELVYSAEKMPVYYDHSFATIKKSDTEFYFWATNGGGTDDCRELGSEFYIYWRVYSRNINMWRRKVSITMTTAR